MTSESRPGIAVPLVAKATISIALLFTIFFFVPVRSVMDGLQGTRIGYALVGLAVTPLTLYVGATQIKIFADRQNLTLTTWQIFRISYITQFYGLFLPGIIAGGAIRWYKFTRQDRKPAEALATIAYSRLMNLSVGTGIGLLCWLSDPAARQNVIFGAGLAVVLVALVGGHYLFLHRELTRRLIAFISSRQSVSNRLRQGINRVLSTAVEFRELGQRQILSVVAVYVLYHTLATFSFVMFACAANIDLAAVSIAWIRTYLLLIALLPISIGGFGVREGGLIIMLAAYGVLPEIAVAYSLLLFGRQLLSALVGGAVELSSFLTTRRLEF